MPEKIKAVTVFKRALYRNLFPQISTLTEADYFLQFNGYEIFLPQRLETDALNIFELSVLKFKGLGNFSTEKLADKLCLEKEFVNFILIRLTELGLLDDKRQITNLGRRFIGEKINAPTKNIVPYLLLVTRDTGEIFPSFFSRQNQTEGESEKNNIKIFLDNSMTVEGRCIFVKEQISRVQSLPQKKIHDALKKFNRNIEDKIFVESAANIQSTYTQPIFLHVKIILQNGNVDYTIVSDGQTVHSDFLRDYLERQNANIFIKLKEISERRKEDETQSNTYQQKLNAQISVIRALGEETFQNLSADVQELTLKISPDKSGRQIPGTFEFVNILAMILEKILFLKLKKFPAEILTSKTEIIRRLVKADKSTNFQTVGENFYLKACKKEPANLGAYALAYMATLTESQFDKFIAANLHKLISELATLRGYANNLALMLEEKNLFNLRDSVFTAIKLLEDDKFDTDRN